MKLKTVLVALLVITLSCPLTLADPQTIDLETMTIEELESLVKDASAQIDAITPQPTPAPYTTYEKGSKGDGVKAIQQRLIDLKYLTGSADGGYGEKTAQAVTDFQKAAGLTPSGVADSQTQATLFNEDAKENPEPPFDPSSYEKLNYKAVARDPEAYEYKLVQFSGKVIQVLEDGSVINYRIATKGSYDDVVLVEYIRPEGASRILEDDKVTVYGLCTGVYTYSSTLGGKITIPSAIATKIELR